MKIEKKKDIENGVYRCECGGIDITPPSDIYALTAPHSLIISKEFFKLSLILKLLKFCVERFYV